MGHELVGCMGLTLLVYRPIELVIAVVDALILQWGANGLAPFPPISVRLWVFLLSFFVLSSLTFSIFPRQQCRRSVPRANFALKALYQAIP
jgi:hypothetical protein